MKKLINTLVALALIMASCNKETPWTGGNDNGGNTEPDPEIPELYSVNGNVQKGPFTQGTSITISALDKNLNPTGKNYQTKTSDDAGTFKISNQIESRFIEIIATGYYFNEIKGKVSGSTLTLRALSDLTETGKTNVNLLTTLEADRIKKLVLEQGKTVAEARAQAERELFNAFHIPETTSFGFDKMDITCEGKENAILLAISATLQGEHSEGELSELISKIATEIEKNGAIKNELIQEQIRTSGMTVKSNEVRDNLDKRYQSLGISSYVIPQFEDYLDVNGNGIVDKEDSWLILSQKDFTFPDSGGKIEVELQHNVEYEIAIENDGSDWIKGNNTKAYLETDRLEFIVEPNEDYDARYARIVIKDKGSSHTEYINVSQKQKDALILTSSDHIEVGTSGGEIEIALNANVNYTVEIGEECKSWIVQGNTLPTKGLSASTLHFIVKPSEEAEVRVGHITVRSGILSETVTIYQAGGEVLVLGQKDFVVSDKGGTVSVDITSNVEYDVIMPPTGWINETMLTKGIVTNTRTFNVSANHDYEQREAEIIFRSRKSGYQEKIRIYQTQKDAIIIAKQAYQFDNNGGRINMELQTNVDVTAEIPDDCKDWISPAPATKGLETKLLSFIVDKNSSYDNREGEIIIRSIDGTLSETVKVYQTQKNAIILNQDKYDFTAEGGNFTVEVNANIDFEVQKSPTYWLKQVQTKSLTSHTLHYSVEANDTYESRTASILFVNRATNIAAVVHISQAAKNGLIIGTDKYEVTYLGDVVNVNVNSNVQYKVEIKSGAEWLSISPDSKALTPSTVSIIAARNDSYKSRTGTVRIFDDASGLSSTVTIEQEPSRELQTIHIPKAGTLSQIIDVDDLKKIVNLKFSGYMNENDIKLLTLKQGNSAEYKSSFKVETLDLSEVTFTDNTLGGFNWLPYLREVKLPSSLKKMEGGEGTFDGCISLTKVDFGENPQLEVLGTGAYQNYNSINRDFIICGPFSNCYSLTKMEIPSSVTTIKAGAFYGSGLKELIIPEDTKITELSKHTYYITNSLGGVQPRDFGTFYGCTELETINIPAKIIMVGDYAFKGWTGLKNIVIPETVKYIMPEGLFEGCSSLETVSMPSNVKTIAAKMFNGCKSLKSISFAKGYNTIEANAFNGCESLETINLEGVTTIANGAFAGCGFTHIRIPDNMTEIPAELFKGCTKLNTVDFNKTEIIGEQAFRDCISFTDIVIPETVREIRRGAFYCMHFDANHDGISDNGCVNKKKVKILSTDLLFDSYSQYPTFDCENLESFTIGRNVRSIRSKSKGDIFNKDFTNFIFEEGAVIEEIGIFSGLNISTIDLPSSVKKIGDYGFSGCKNLSGIEELLQGIEEIGTYAFYDTNITSVDVPEGVKSIRAYAFSNCKNLRFFTLPSTLAFLGSAVFSNNPKLLSSTINGGELVIERNLSNVSGLFSKCPYISEIIIGKDIISLSVDYISGSSDYNPLLIKEQTARFEEGSRCTSLDGPLFKDSPQSSIELPQTLTYLGDYVFYNCKNLTQIALPEGLTHIGNAFGACVGLKNMEIPSSVITIGSEIKGRAGAFDNCVFDSFVINAPFTVPEVRGGNPFGYPTIEELIINCDIVEGMFIPAAKKITIKEGCTAIPANAFKDKTTLKEIILPSTIETIGDYAFSGCKNLTSVSIPKAVSAIGKYAFAGCSNLMSIDIPEELTSISDYTFYNCSGLTTITLPKNLTAIGMYAFKGCTSLTSINLPEGLTTIGHQAFYDCNGLCSITIPSTVTSWNYSFTKSGLTAVVIDEGITEIPFNAFSECSALISINLPKSLKTIGSSAFERCTSLASINLPDGLTTIQSSAFRNCSGLTSITVPEGITYIKNHVFYGCKSLTSITLPSTLIECSYQAFSVPHNIKEVYCKSTTPRTYSYLVNSSDMETIYYVPRQSLDLYLNHTSWKAHASQIVGYDY